jgi:hypothetical protein
MAPAALGAANTALAAVAAGIVTATNYAGTGLIGSAGAAEKTAPSLLGYTAGVRSAGIAMEAFSPTVGTAASSLLSFLRRRCAWSDGSRSPLMASSWSARPGISPAKSSPNMSTLEQGGRRQCLDRLPSAHHQGRGRRDHGAGEAARADR